MKKFTLLLFSVLIAVLAISGCNFLPTLTTGSISGKVVDSNSNPLNGATVSIPSLSMTTTTNSTGNFTFAQINYGTYTVHAEMAEYQPTDTNVTIGMNNPNPNITITMAPAQVSTKGTVSVEVFKTDNTPLGNANVIMGTYTGVTDSNGKVVFQQVPAGEYTVTAEKAGYVSGSKNISVVANQTTEVKFNLAVVSPDSGTVAVRVLQTDNAPISGANVTFASYERTTGADGTVIFENIPAGNYTIAVSKDGYAAATKPITVVTGQLTNVEFKLEAVNPGSYGTVTGVVEKHDHSPVPGINVKMDGYLANTDQDGRFTWNQVPPGEHIVQIYEDEFEPAEQTITVVAGQTTNVVLTLIPRLGSLSGVVKDANMPLEGVTVSLKGTNFITTTNVNGVYEFFNLRYDTYTLDAFKEGYTPVSKEITISQPTTTQDIILEVVPNTNLDQAKAMVNDVNTSLYLLGDMYVDEQSVIKNHFTEVMVFETAIAPYLQEMGSGLTHLQVIEMQPGVYNFSTYDEWGYPIYELVSAGDPDAETWAWTVNDTFNGLHINISVPNVWQHITPNESETELTADFLGTEFLYSLTSDNNPEATYEANILIGSSNVTSYDFVSIKGYWDEFDNYHEIQVVIHVLVPSGKTATASCFIEPDSDLENLNGIHIGATLDLEAIEDRHIFVMNGSIDTPVFNFYGEASLELVGPDMLNPYKYRFFAGGNFVNSYYTVHGNFDAAFRIIPITDEWGETDYEHVLSLLQANGGYESPSTSTSLVGSFIFEFTNINEFQFDQPVSDLNYEKYHINLAGAVDKGSNHYEVNFDVTRPQAEIANIHTIVNTPANHLEGNVVVDDYNNLAFLSMTNQAGIGVEFDFSSTDLQHLGRVFDRVNNTLYANIVGLPGEIGILSVNFTDGSYVQFPLDFWTYIQP